VLVNLFSIIKCQQLLFKKILVEEKDLRKIEEKPEGIQI